jgi:hypothetical protein
MDGGRCIISFSAFSETIANDMNTSVYQKNLFSIQRKKGKNLPFIMQNIVA